VLDKTLTDVAGNSVNAHVKLGYMIAITREAAEGVMEIMQPLPPEICAWGTRWSGCEQT